MEMSMNPTRTWLTALLACGATTLSACAPVRLQPVTRQATPDPVGARSPRSRAPSQTPPRTAQRSTEFIASFTPSWFPYGDRAGGDPGTREEASEKDFQFLKGTGLQRIVLPRALSADQFPVQVDDILGETALQLECEGGGCDGLSMSVRSPDGRGIVVRLDTGRAFPVLWIKNPTMYKHSVELNIDRQSTRGLPVQLKLSQWRYYLWAQ